MTRTRIEGKNSIGEPRLLQVNDSGSIDVALQDQTTPTLFMKAIIEEGTFTLLIDLLVGDTKFDLSPGHGVSVGDVIEFYSDTRWLQAHVIGLIGDEIEIDQPIDYAYPSATTVCYRGLDELNVNGSVTPVIARIKNVDLLLSWDITQVDVYLQDATDMDNAMFGGLGSALANGVLWRGKKIVDASTIYKNSFIAKVNADMVLLANNFAFNDRAPSGSFSLSLKKLLGGQDNLGVVFRMVMGENAELQVIIQDNLTGLEAFWVRYEGSVVLP